MDDNEKLTNANEPTEKQLAWLAHFLTDANYNATQAARLAGYAEDGLRVAGFRARAKFSDKIEKHFAANAMGKAELLHRLSDISRGPGDYITLKPDPVTNEPIPFVDLERLKADGQSHLIKAVKQTTAGINIEFQDPQAAMDKIARLGGYYQDRMDLTSKGEKLDLGAEVLSKAAKELNAWREEMKTALSSLPSAPPT